MMSAHRRATPAGSSVNWDGLMQNVVKPADACSGMASRAWPRSATAPGAGNTAREAPTRCGRAGAADALQQRQGPACGAKGGVEGGQFLGRRAAEGVVAGRVADQAVQQ